MHGLSYPPALLPSLPVLHQRPHPLPPIRALSAAQFAALHLHYLLAHAHTPDTVLFPFLHGLEGSNAAQTQFFTHVNPGFGYASSPPIRVPQYRGLVWVVCDDDLDTALRLPGACNHSHPADHMDDDDDEGEDELDDDGYSDESTSDIDQFTMDVDTVADVAVHIHGHNEDCENENQTCTESDVDGAHMHPVHHRTTPANVNTSSGNTNTVKSPITQTHGPAVPLIQTNFPPFDRRTSCASTTSTFSSAISTTTESSSFFASSPSSPATSISSAYPGLPKNENTVSTDMDTDVSPTPVPSGNFAITTPTPVVLPPNSPKPATQLEPRRQTLPLLTSTFHPEDLLTTASDGQPEFVPLRVPDGISLRNFGIQVPIYATISDIVIYSPKGLTRASLALAEKFKIAVERKREDRVKMRGSKVEDAGKRREGGNEGDEDEGGLLTYNVFVMTATAEEMDREMPHLMVRLQGSRREGTGVDVGRESGEGRERLKPNTIDFAQREKDEMRDLTRASEIISVTVGDNAKTDPNTNTSDFASPDLRTTKTHWDPHTGQVFLGNSNDVPLVPDMRTASRRVGSTNGRMLSDDPFDYSTNDPAAGFGYDICVECHDFAPFPSVAHLRAAEEHLTMLDKAWAERWWYHNSKSDNLTADPADAPPIPPRPPPNASAVIHLPFPSSPPSNSASISALLPVVKFFECVLQPPNATTTASMPPAPAVCGPRRWSSSVSSLMPGFPPFPLPSAAISSDSGSNVSGSSPFTRHRSATSPISSPPTTTTATTAATIITSATSVRPVLRTRPLKILLYSSDGYTESSVPALCLLMAVRRLSLPEAYLELQVVKRRSFFVYQGDLGVLRRVEGRLGVNTVAKGEREGCGRWALNGSRSRSGSGSGYAHAAQSLPSGRPAANSVSFSQSPLASASTTATGVGASSTSPPTSPSDPPSSSLPAAPMVVPSQSHLVRSRPRASTSPWLPSVFGGDHQAWFNDPRFDGSFPSRVLPFLYLGNLNHASNAYMLHALGITHVVSVGECALVPPPHVNGPSTTAAACHRPSTGPYFVAGKGPGHQGSLWIEEKEGRIKVLDIKGVCDDGIDTLEPQLEPICEWIEKARLEGGQVLVHCRVGVSRSATVTIAYVMKHLRLPLVDAYLIVRSRRLSVLIQPNMRLLYNLCGWEIRLARERAGEDEERLKEELARTLSWPYLAKEVHALNEKYLH